MSSSIKNGLMYTFVYGTLKRNEPNCQWLVNEGAKKSTFVSEGRTKEKYPLVIASRYNIPFLVDKRGVGNQVRGEVYEINEAMLANLDILEEYPKLYDRREEEIILDGEDQKIVKAVTYFLTDYKEEMLNLEYFDCYSSHGAHNYPYLASEDDLDDAKDIITETDLNK